MSRPNPPSPVIQILLILASALAGCVYVPLSTEKYPGELDKPHINEMIGESVQAIETRLGKPTLRFRYRDSKYFVYRYPVKQKAFMAGVAPIGGPTLFIPVPFAGVVTEDVDICVRIEFDHDRKMVNYDVGDPSLWGHRCIRRFWESAELEKLRESLLNDTTSGDLDAAWALVDQFDLKSHKLVEERIRQAAEQGNLDAAVKAVKLYQYWKPLKELAKHDANAANELKKLREDYSVFSVQDRNEIAARANQGQSKAQLQLYYSTLDDPQLAHHWLCQAADNSYPEAQYRLGVLHQFGSEGLSQDLMTAYMWYFLSAKSYPPSANALASVKSQMTDEQVQIADKLVAEWRPGQCWNRAKARMPK